MEEFQGLLIIMVVVWVTGKIFRSLSLPVLFGELLGGILVGPLVLGIVNPDSETIKILAELGIFFLMLHTGLETDPKELLRSSKKSILISFLGDIVPFVTIFSLAKYFGFTTEQSIFLALGLSMTAIAITVRLLKESKLAKTNIGHTILGAAIVSDIFALIAFSVILGVIEQGQFELTAFLTMVVKIVLFFVAVIFTGFKTAKYLKKALKNKGFTFALIVALSLGLLAEQLGMHMIIGAFLAGLFIRQEVLDKKVFDKIEDRIYGLSYSFLGPIFFTSLAFKLDLSAIFSKPKTLIFICLAAIFGKFFGASMGAYIQKISFKKAVIIGLAMNSRGAIDLVIASIGLEKGIINSEIFSIMVITAFTATLFSIFTTKPLAKHAK
jgi:Kef-type K+ transport system membrane component KefB